MSVLVSILNLVRFQNRNWKAVTLCLLAATVFWFFNALNKNYTTNITFPLTFEYNEQNYVEVRPLPRTVRLNVTGMGWDLFRRSLGVKVPPLVIPLDRPAEIRKIVGSPALFANQLERFEINFVLTDTLHIALEPKAGRWISLRIDTPTILFRQGYVRTSEPQITPDSIYIEGPWKLVKSFSEPVYLKLAQRNIDEDFNEDVEVKFLNDELIKRSPPTVNVSFRVDEQVVVTDSIALSIINYPQGANPYYGVKSLPGTFAIPSSLVNQYNRDSVTAVIDLKDFVRGTQKIRPEVKGLPPHSRVLNIDSILVKF